MVVVILFVRVLVLGIFIGGLELGIMFFPVGFCFPAVLIKIRELGTESWGKRFFESSPRAE